MPSAVALDRTASVSNLVWGVLALAMMASLLFINLHSIITLLFALLIAQCVASICLTRSCLPEVAKAFVFYCVMSILVYLLQLIALPEYHGFSGPPWVGTDDSYFFSLGSPDIPADLPLRVGYYLRVDPYGKLLRIFGNLTYEAFGAVHPLDLILINASLVALLPSLVASITAQFMRRHDAYAFSWWLTLLCPFIVANSVVLLRDGLIATAYAGAVLSLLQRRYVLVSIWVFFSGYLRLQHGVMLIGILWMIGVASYITQNDTKNSHAISIWRVSSIWMAPLLLVFPCVLLVSGDTLVSLLAGSSLVREEFLTTFIAEGAARDTGTSTFYVITQLPWFIRVPTALIFYFLSPLFDITRLVSANVFVVRDYLMNLFAIAMIAYVAFFFKGMAISLYERRWTLISMLFSLLLCLSLISQASMQLRHKLPLMVLFYPFVAIGMVTPVRAPLRLVAVVVAGMVGSVEIIFNGYKLL